VSVVAVRHIDEAAVRPLTFGEVLRMVEAGILDEDDRVELVDGVLVEMSPEGILHVEVIADLNRLLTGAYPAPFDVRVQSTYPLDRWQFRQPDLVVAHRIRGRWLGPDDVVLVIEVAQTSIRYDTGRKARDYAAGGVRNYWVFDIDRRQLIVHTDLGGDGYRTVEAIPEAVARALPDAEAELRVADILPPPAV